MQRTCCAVYGDTGLGSRARNPELACKTTLCQSLPCCSEKGCSVAVPWRRWFAWSHLSDCYSVLLDKLISTSGRNGLGSWLEGSWLGHGLTCKVALHFRRFSPAQSFHCSVGGLGRKAWASFSGRISTSHRWPKFGSSLTFLKIFDCLNKVVGAKLIGGRQYQYSESMFLTGVQARSL